MGAKIVFPEVIKGYDMEQVDSYISKLSDAYQEAYDENMAIRGKYNSLLEDFRKMSAQEQAALNPEVILMYAEILAQKIITDTQEEAAQIKADAQKTLTEGSALAAQMKAEAQRILTEANAEATRIVFRARKNMEQAQDIMEQTITRVQDILAFNGLDIKSYIA
jgi:cell division septum initiation protein DivIVA